MYCIMLLIVVCRLSVACALLRKDPRWPRGEHLVHKSNRNAGVDISIVTIVELIRLSQVPNSKNWKSDIETNNGGNVLFAYVFLEVI